MVLISFLLLINISFCKELDLFLTKYPLSNLRFISSDGKTVYVQKKPGVLSVINGYNSVDFLVEEEKSNFLVQVSKEKNRVAIESIPNPHSEYNLFKNHTLYVTNFGGNKPKKIGLGKNIKLHLFDEWVTYFNSYNKKIFIENIITEKKFEVPITNKFNPFFQPEHLLVTSSNFLYTDLDENGLAVLISLNLLTNIKTIIYQAAQPGTKIEICKEKQYLAFGEFPYEGLSRSSKIMLIKLSGSTNLAGYETIYNNVDHDIGNITCMPEELFFIKTIQQNDKLKTKTSDIFKIVLKDSKLEQVTSAGNITQMLEMDGKILVPLRGEIFIVYGENNLSSDDLKKSSSSKNEEQAVDL